MMEKERLPEASPLAATVSPGGEATAGKPGERGIWQISQLRAKASKAEWRDNRVVGESLERFQNPEMKPRNQFLQREAYSPSLADQLAFQPLGSPARVSRPTERRSPSLGSLQQGEIEQPPQTSGQPSLSLHQLIEALQQLGVVQKPGELQPVSLQMREAQHVQQPLRGLLQQRASPPPAVQQQRRPLQPPLAQPPLGDLQQQGAPPAPAGQQQRAQQPLDQQAGWGQQQLGAPQARRLDQQPGWGQQPQPQWRPQQPVFTPPFKATFDGDPEKLLFFLNQVRSHLNRWAYLYPEPGAMVSVMTSNLEGEASEWLDNLYSEQAPELEDPHLFLLSLRERFEDPSIGLKAAGQIHKIKQAGRPALEYVREFRKIADRIEGWPEQCLLHHFIEGLDDHLAQACIYREVPDRLQEWYQTAVKLDVKLSRYKKPPSPEIEPKPERPRREPTLWRPPTTTSTDRPRPPAGPPLVCFRCGQGGHRAANCPVPYPPLQNRPEPAMRKKPAQRLTREKSNRLTQEPVAQITPPTQEDAGTPGGPAPALPFFDSDDEGENDPMEDNLHWSEDYSESSHESLEREPDPWRVRRETQAERSHEPESTTSMEEKLRQLQEERMCKVCMDKDVSIVLVPCGHLVVCAECAPNLSRCPICRGDIRDSMKAFLS